MIRFSLVFGAKVFLCSPGCPRTPDPGQAGLSAVILHFCCSLLPSQLWPRKQSSQPITAQCVEKIDACFKRNSTTDNMLSNSTFWNPSGKNRSGWNTEYIDKYKIHSTVLGQVGQAGWADCKVILIVFTCSYNFTWKITKIKVVLT